MREIKFKIWSNAGKVFLGSKYTHISADGQSIDCCGDKYNTWDEVTLLQFTGLKDKNGIEMYESDIVKFHYFFQSLGENLGVQESEHELIGVVCYHNFGWGINAIKGEHWQAYTGYNAGEGHSNFLDLMAMNESSIHEESFEIIGNIYENPELLNSDKNVQGSVATDADQTTNDGKQLKQ